MTYLGNTIMRHVPVILTLLVCTTGAVPADRIWGGQSATSGQFPYIVALNDPYPFQYCAGVIIAPNWILTTAHCLYFITSQVEMYVGSNVNGVNGTAIRVTHMIVHEEYSSWDYQNDVGLIKLETDLEFSDTVQAIPLADVVAPGTECVVLGWGSLPGDIYQDYLYYVDNAVVDMDLCLNISTNSLYGMYLGPEQLCTLGAQGTGTCVSDDGGPLVCDGKLAGVVSYRVGFDCGIGLPDVYTSVPFYLNWILTKIQP